MKGKVVSMRFNACFSSKLKIFVDGVEVVRYACRKKGRQERTFYCNKQLMK
jgi:hypothetical protein